MAQNLLLRSSFPGVTTRRRDEGRWSIPKILFSTAMSGVGVDQVVVVESEKEVLIAVVNGSEDAFVN